MTLNRLSKHAAVSFCLLCLIGAASPPAAEALCTAQEVIAAASGCPVGAGTCTINTDITVQNGCTLDFGTRAVRLAAKITIGSAMVTIKAGSFTVEDRTSTFIDGAGANGGTIRIQTTGNFESLRRAEAINVDGTVVGGNIIIEAGGNVSLVGDLFARGSTNAGGGGDITIRARGNFSNTNQSEISALGGSTSLGGGGTIDINADGSITLLGPLSVRGSEGGSIDVLGGGVVQVSATLDATPLTASDAGSGGEVNVEGGSVNITGLIRADGNEGTFQSGGCGGFVCIIAFTGNILVDEDITADGASPDGSGGEISIDARGSLQVQAKVSARSKGVDGCGGGICLNAGLDLTMASNGSVTSQCGGTGAGGEGGGAGGDVELLAARALTMNGLVDVAGKNNDTSGGSVNLEAGTGGSGTLTVSNLVDVRGGGCGLDFCGDAGSADLTGCDVTVASAGRILATAQEQGGDTTLVAHEQLRIAGQINSQRIVPTGVQGVNRLQHPARKPAIITGSVLPAPTTQALATCVFQGQTNPPCLVPCPVCGNGINEFPETCDLGMMPPVSCSGACSLFCQQEVCEDDLMCTANSCNPQLGCIVAPIPNCTEPPPPTATPRPPTPTPTPRPCFGDCNGDGMVSVSELVVGVNIALGNLEVSECPLLDVNPDGSVGIDELLVAVNNALLGCP